MKTRKTCSNKSKSSAWISKVTSETKNYIKDVGIRLVV